MLHGLVCGVLAWAHFIVPRSGHHNVRGHGSIHIHRKTGLYCTGNGLQLLNSGFLYWVGILLFQIGPNITELPLPHEDYSCYLLYMVSFTPFLIS
jgi:hypothetical protein